jgi:coenzyme F420-dependent glucose-6-phosphate dehydrogenase
MQSPLPSGKSIGYICVPDLRDANTLLRHAALAKKAGFGMIWVSDHFHPWAHTNGHESHTWTWMSTALERIDTIGFGTAVTAPVFRYHPALVAQAFATMQVMHGPRVILGVGTGEGMNEIPLGFQYTSLAERREIG